MNFIESCRDQNREIVNQYIDTHPDFNIAIEFNNLVLQNEQSIMEWLCSVDTRMITTITPDTILELIKRSQYNTLEWIQGKSLKIQEVIWSVIKTLLRSGDVEILESFANNLPCVDKLLSLRMIPILIELVQRNQLDVLKWFHGRVLNIMYTFQHYQLYTIAFENGYQELLDWLVALEPNPLYYYNYTSTFEKSCLAGNIKLAKLLYMSYPISLSELDSTVFKECAIRGHLEIMQWMHSIHKEHDYDAGFINACRNGKISILGWLLEIEHIDKKTILEGFACACHNDDTEVIAFLFDHCHRSLATRHLMNHVSKLIHLKNDTTSIDIILDNIYLRNELEDITMIFHKDIMISSHILLRYPDLTLDYSYLFTYYANKKQYDLCKIIVDYHRTTIQLTHSNVIAIVTDVITGMDHYSAIEILELIYRINPVYFDPIRNTLFTNACYRNETVLASWFVQKFPDHYLIVTNASGLIIESYILKTLPRSGNLQIATIEICSICMIENSNIVTNCHHQFCYSCINQWYNKKPTCPICRAELRHCFAIKIIL